MLQIKKSNRWMILILSSSALAVWAVILYQIITGIEYDQEMDTQFEKEQEFSEVNVLPKWYDESFIENIKEMRDPFRLKSVKKKFPKPTPKIKPKPIQSKNILPPDFAYVGYLSDGTASLALIQFHNGETRICREGDSIKTVQLQEIYKNEIKVKQKDDVHILHLKR